MFYEKLAEAKEEKKRRLSAKQKLGLGLGAAGLLTAGILGRKRIGAMFNRGAHGAHAPKPKSGVVGDGVVDTPEELFDFHLYHYGNLPNKPYDVLTGTQDVTDEVKKLKRVSSFHEQSGKGAAYLDRGGKHKPYWDSYNDGSSMKVLPAGHGEDLTKHSPRLPNKALGEEFEIVNRHAITPYKITNLTREQADGLLTNKHGGQFNIADLLEANPHVRVQSGPAKAMSPESYAELKKHTTRY